MGNDKSVTDMENSSTFFLWRTYKISHNLNQTIFYRSVLITTTDKNTFTSPFNTSIHFYYKPFMYCPLLERIHEWIQILNPQLLIDGVDDGCLFKSAKNTLK